MNVFEVLVVIAFIILLIVAICFIVSFYVCDGYNCKAFTTAESQAPRGTKEYALALLTELYNDGIWPLPYVAAAIITPFILWFLCVPMTARAFALVFLVSWLFIYFAFAFLGHHYIRFLAVYVSEYIQDSCPGSTFIRQRPIYNEDENNDDNNSGTTPEPNLELSVPITFNPVGVNDPSINSNDDPVPLDEPESLSESFSEPFPDYRTFAPSYSEPASGIRLGSDRSTGIKSASDRSPNIKSFSDLLVHNFSVPVDIYR